MEQGKVQVTHDNEMYIDLYCTVEQQIETTSGKPQETDQKLCLMTNHTVTIPPSYIL